MGLARGAIGLLLEEGVARPFSGRAATLGRQTVYATGREVLAQFRKFGIEPKSPIDANAAELDDATLFRALGFEDVTSLDYSDFEGASYVVDLNQPGLPEALVGSFDVVLDSGTLEHVFHVPHALRNMMSMAKVGGRVIFLAPSSNHLDHGFYMFSPTFFSDYLAANRFRIEKLYVVRYSGDLDALWEAYEYEPGKWRDLHIGGLDDKPYAIYVVATRTPEATTDAIPQQGFYSRLSEPYRGSRLASGGVAEAPALAQRAAEGAEPVEGSAPAAAPPGRSLRAQVKAALCYVPGGLFLARRVRNGLRKLGRSVSPASSVNGIRAKKLVGRY